MPKGNGSSRTEASAQDHVPEKGKVQLCFIIMTVDIRNSESSTDNNAHTIPLLLVPIVTDILQAKQPRVFLYRPNKKGRLTVQQ